MEINLTAYKYEKTKYLEDEFICNYILYFWILSYNM